MADSLPAAEKTPQPPRVRSIGDSPALAARAAELLRTPQALMPLEPDEARTVVERMRLVTFPKGATLFREGELGSSYLLLLLEGEISVDAGSAGPAVALSVLGPGSVIGEMALLDGAPRSANCVAISPVHAAGLSRGGLETLVDEHPRVAAKLMIGLSQRIAERLRALGQQLQIYAGLAATPPQETGRQRERHG